MKKKNSSLILKGLTHNGEAFTKEIHTLDEVKSTGSYTVICRNASTGEGLPAISGHTENCFCCEAQLIVTGCYSENESQSDTAYGQTITICDRETGNTATYTRTITPTKNDGKWSEWQMVATGDIELVSQNSDINKQLTTLATEQKAEVARATNSEEQLQKSINNISKALDYTDVFSAYLTNGTQGNGGNAYAVRTWKKLPGEVGKTYAVIVNRPVDENCKYIYGYATYTSLEGYAYEYYSRIVEYGAKSTINYVTLQQGEVGFTFVITQLNETTGEYVPLRVTTDFQYVKIHMLNKLDNIQNNIDYLLKRDSTPKIYNRNLDKVATLSAMCQYRKTLVAPKKDYQKLLCTDIHTDKTALSNAIDALNSFETIDALFFLGDITGSFYEPGFINTFNELCTKAEKPFYTVVGNHDVGNTKYVGACASHEQVYESFVKPMVDAGHLTQGEYSEGIPYWYHDDATYKVRLIGLYEYDDPMDFDDEYWEMVAYSGSYPNIVGNTTYNVGDYGNAYVFGGYGDRPVYTQYSFKCKKACTTGIAYYNSPQAPSYKIQRGQRVIRQTQAQWFIDTLASTPADYTVIVAMHNPFSDIAKTIEAKFSQGAGLLGSAYAQNLMLTDFIANAVNAFINGANYNEKVVMKGDAAYMNTLNDGSIDYAYEVAKDFSTKKTGVKFGCFIGGHTHRDFVWKHPTYNLYQVTPLCATTNISNATGCDIRRTENDGPAKDSLTTVSITDNRIALAKIGVNITENATLRDCEIIRKS